MRRAMAWGGSARWYVGPAGLAVVLWAMIGLLPAQAGPVAVEHVSVARAFGQWRISVTLRHADTGWEHYAMAWIVESEAGELLGRRVLLHPHVNEQPFTRSQTMTLPQGIRTIRVRAKDNLGGCDSNVVVVRLDQAKGPRFDVRRQVLSEPPGAPGEASSVR